MFFLNYFDALFRRQVEDTFYFIPKSCSSDIEVVFLNAECWFCSMRKRFVDSTRASFDVIVIHSIVSSHHNV